MTESTEEMADDIITEEHDKLKKKDNQPTDKPSPSEASSRGKQSKNKQKQKYKKGTTKISESRLKSYGL